MDEPTKQCTLQVRVEGIDTLKPCEGDTVVLRVDLGALGTNAESLQRTLAEAFPDNRVIVLDKGMALDCITPEGMDRLRHPLRTLSSEGREAR